VPATGHSAIGSDFSGCAQTAFARFVQRRPVPPRCRPVSRAIAPVPPPPGRLSDVARLSGSSGIRGRTLAAVKLTLRDVLDDSLTQLVFDPNDPNVARGGGLRAGRYRLNGDLTLYLKGVVFVPGVTVTGRIENFALGRQHGRLRIGGRAAPHGVLTIRRQHASGRLGGRRVSAKLNAPSAVVALSARRDRWPIPPGAP
jgi:hypothetical protein